MNHLRSKKILDRMTKIELIRFITGELQLFRFAWEANPINEPYILYFASEPFDSSPLFFVKRF